MRFTIRKKLMFGYMAVLSLMIVVSIIAYVAMGKVDRSVSDILVYAHKYDMVNGLRYSVKQFLDVNDSLIKGQIQDVEYYRSMANDTEKKILYVSKLRLKEDEKDLLKKIKDEFTLIRDRAEKTLKWSKGEKNTKLAVILREIDRAKPVLINSLEGLYDEAWRSLDNVTISADKERERGIWQITTFSIIAIVVGVGIAIYISQRIIVPLKALSSAAGDVARGDLKQRVEETTEDELGELIISFNQMVLDLETSRDQIEKYNKELQAMVEERTVELEKTKEYLENILEYSGDMIITTTLFDEIVQFNRGAENMLGYNKEGMVGAKIEDLFANRNDYRKLREKVVVGGDVSNYDTRLMKKDGKVVDVNLTLSQLKDRAGDTIGLVGIGRDITEKKKHEEEQKKYADRLLREIEESARISKKSEKAKGS
jgi:PAS domain S-box-containing protein